MRKHLDFTTCELQLSCSLPPIFVVLLLNGRTQLTSTQIWCVTCKYLFCSIMRAASLSEEKLVPFKISRVRFSGKSSYQLQERTHRNTQWQGHSIGTENHGATAFHPAFPSIMFLRLTDRMRSEKPQGKCRLFRKRERKKFYIKL